MYAGRKFFTSFHSSGYMKRKYVTNDNGEEFESISLPIGHRTSVCHLAAVNFEK